MEIMLKKHLRMQDLRFFWNSSRARKGYSGTGFNLIWILLSDLGLTYAPSCTILLLMSEAIICVGSAAANADLQVSYGIGDEIGDVEGRSITVENENFSLTNVYSPNSGDGLKRLDYRVRSWDSKVNCVYN